MATTDNALVGIPTAKLVRNEPTANSVFLPVSTTKSLCARRNVPHGSPFIRVAVFTCEHVKGLHCIFSHLGTQITRNFCIQKTNAVVAVPRCSKTKRKSKAYTGQRKNLTDIIIIWKRLGMHPPRDRLNFQTCAEASSITHAQSRTQTQSCTPEPWNAWMSYAHARRNKGLWD